MIRQPTSRDDFPVAIICAKTIEYDAICLLMDGWHEGYEDEADKGDNNTYTFGWMGDINIVLFLLLTNGDRKLDATAAAVRLESGFPKLKLAILVGICGGVPGSVMEEDMLLGDVIISDGLLQHDFGKQLPGGYQIYKDTDNQPRQIPDYIMGLLKLLQTDHWFECFQTGWMFHFGQLLQKAGLKGKQATYTYPGTTHDRLFEPAYAHKHQSDVCAQCHNIPGLPCEESQRILCSEIGCSDGRLVQRRRLEERRICEGQGSADTGQDFRVIFGKFASGSTLMRDAVDRDRIAKPHKAMAFEMEGVGIWNPLPSLIIKGVSDYADSHKNDIWQGYAAATAASVARALLDLKISFLRAGAQKRAASPSQIVSTVKRPRSRSGRGLPRVRCFKCDGSHYLPKCTAGEEIVQKARESRREEGRCFACGGYDHWWERCEYDYLLWT
jgi:nucleoside phosphorylase